MDGADRPRSPGARRAPLRGEPLADRLARGPLPIEQVLRFGVQIAGALDKAHRQGIVHRDPKPANIMITKSGAKLLDFGLAKQSEEAALGLLLPVEVRSEHPFARTR